MGGKPINVIKFLSPHANAQQNFRIFWVGRHSYSMNNKEACLNAAIVIIILVKGKSGRIETYFTIKKLEM